MTRLGYLVPEFPAQTHAFFWRECRALRGLDVEPVLISTRQPDRRIQAHAWTREAAEQTTYLTRLGVGGAWSVVATLLRAGPAGWWRAWRAAFGGEGIKAGGRRLALLPFAARLVALSRRAGFGHVHVHSCANAAVVAMLAERLGGPSYSVTLHGPLKDYGPGQRGKWSHAAFGIVITRKLEGELHEALDGHLPDVVRVAPMGVEVEAFARQRPYTAYRGEGPATLFSCGRLNPIKGHAEAIRAVKRLVSEGVDVRLRIAGQDERGGDGYAVKLRALIDELGVGQHVELLGAVDEQRVRRELEDADLFVLASHHEPLGVAIMEAMAMGCPVVTTAAGGVAELVDDGIDGRLVPPKDPDALAEAIRGLLHDPAAAERLASAGRSKIERGFHSGVSAAVIAELMPKPDGAAASGTGEPTREAAVTHASGGVG